MSLTDKVIKNTVYHFTAQIFGLFSPFILTPIIINRIGQVEFGIYAIVMGFVGTFGIFDLSLSASFIKFISEHYNKKEINELNSTINTGLFFYVAFSVLICVIGILLAGPLIKIINIPENLVDLGLFALRISLFTFLFATSTTIFVSVLISLQKMYINSLVGLIINLLNFVSIIILLHKGIGLRGILYSNLGSVLLICFFNVYLAKKELPEMSIRFRYLSKQSFRKMFHFGIQMQVSRVAAFLTEKYDELLLGYFSVLNNVTYMNLSNRVTRLGKFLPLQLFQQVAPVAAELNAKEDTQKLNLLYMDSTKYLTLFSLPIFVYIFTFSDLIFSAWMGNGYSISVTLLRILAVGQLINLMFSAPGNSIIPNLGIPKYLMFEALIALSINLILSYVFIKYYGIWGAAIGSTIATIISSIYVFYTSVKYFKANSVSLLIKQYLFPLIACIMCCIIIYFLHYFVINYVTNFSGRFVQLLTLLIDGTLFLLFYFLVLLKFNFLSEHDRSNLRKVLSLIVPIRTEHFE